MTPKMELSRRSFLKGLLGATAAVAVTTVGKQALAFIDDETISLSERLRRALIAAYPKIDPERLRVGEYGIEIHWMDGQKTTGSWRGGYYDEPMLVEGETEEQKATRIAAAEQAAIDEFTAQCKYHQEHDSDPKTVHVPAYKKRRQESLRNRPGYYW